MRRLTNKPFFPYVSRKLKSIKTCKNCKRKLKNKFNYIPIPKNYFIKDKVSKEYHSWVGVDKICRRCGFYNRAH